jgi:hypothetical protein
MKKLSLFLFLSIGVTLSHADASERTADWLAANARKLQDQRVEVMIESASPIAAGVRDAAGFYCFTRAGSILVVVPSELGPPFFERYGKPKEPQPLTAVLKIANDGRVYLRVHSTTSKTRVWTHADGRKLEADYLWANDNVVRLRRVSDGKEFSLRINDLSTADKIHLATLKTPR